jgi:hypothetical protein
MDGAAGERSVRSDGLGDDVFEQDGPADQGVAAVADAGLDGQMQVAGFVDEAGDFAGGLGDVQEQTTASTRISFGSGMRDGSSCPMGPAR